MRPCLVIVKDYLVSSSPFKGAGGWLLAFLFLLTGCIDDDTSGCSSVISLRVKAEVSVSGGADSENIFNDIGVYAFDAQGVLTEYGRIKSEEDANDQTVKFSVPEGRYTIVTWCGADFDNDYEVVALTPSGAFTRNFVKGETRLSDMRLHAKADGVSNTCIGNLFWGTVKEVEVNGGINLVKIDSKLQKNSNQVEVVLKGVVLPYDTRMGHKGDSPFDVSLHTVAGIYRFDNYIDLEHSAPCTYRPYETEVAGSDLYLRLRTLRLFIDLPVKLTIAHKLTGQILYTADLIDLLRLNPAYRTQADLDREDRYQIVVGQGIATPGIDTGITITVNGWEVVILEPMTKAANTPHPNRRKP